MKLNKIGLITIHRANNYGAFLQTYATQEILKEYGCVEIIDYKNKKLESSFKLVRYDGLNLKSLMGSIKDVLRIIPRRKVISCFQKDISTRYNLSKRLDKYELEQYCNRQEYTHLVCGSDQIWNPICVSYNSNLDNTYTLSFANENVKKISYASSMGDFILDNYNEQNLKKELSTFSAISVREYERKSELELLINKNIEHVLDPTLLLSNSEWLQRFSGVSDRVKKIINKKYILFYSVPKVPQTRNLLKKIYSLLGYEIVSIDQDIYPFYAANYKIRDCTVSEFIHLFNNATFIVTDSFHGVCFSIIFKKDFYSTSPGKLSNRIVSLLNLLNLKDRIIYDVKDVKDIHEIDYSKIENCINSEINKSKSYIIGAVTN